MTPPSKLRPMHRLHVGIIATPLAILFFGTASLLFLSSDKNVDSLWSQCSTSPPPGLLSSLSRIPLLGSFSCFLVSFTTQAISSSRSFAIMSLILSFVGSLLTISTIESARLCNHPNPLIRNPTLPWLIFNLAGGAVAWQLLIVPAFIHRSRAVHRANSASTTSLSPRPVRKSRTSPEPPPSLRQESLESEAEIIDPRHPEKGSERRNLLSHTEIYAIPLSVTLGYYLPSAYMLASPSPASVAIWLFFPLYVSLLRQGIRYALATLPRLFSSFSIDTETHHLESNTPSLLKVYALPVLLSVISQGIFWRSLLTGTDDGSEMTRAALRFIEIDFGAIGATVGYWLLLEADWRVFGAAVLGAVIGGPGAGLVLGWVWKDVVDVNKEAEDGNGDEDVRGVDEESEQLLQ